MTTAAVGSDTLRGSEPAREGSGELRLRALDEATGAPLAVRVRVEARGLLGKSRSLVEGTGEVALALEEGSYDVSVSHGPEWSVYERTVTIDPGRQVSLRAPLRREVDAAAFTGCDLHVHTSQSPDSDLTPAERVASLAAEDVHFVATTDHNQVTDLREELAEVGVASLPGVEVTSWDPEFGHFNVFPRATAPTFKHTNSRELLRALRKDPSAFVQINHPRLETHIGYFELMMLDAAAGALPELGFDGIEVWNGYDLGRPERRERVFTEWLQLLARGVRLVATGGSDSHRLTAPLAGYPRTYVRVARAEPHDTHKVLAALRAGRAFVTSGPILDVEVDGHTPGDTYSLGSDQRSITARITVDAPRWMDLTAVEIWLGPERVAIAPITGELSSPRAKLTLEVEVGNQRTLVVVARGSEPMRRLFGKTRATPYAFTNPVWLQRN